jgi:ABC-type transport system substrate-binding protein/ABC-type dipeptide/oligopeptide/nickel transport system permease component
VVAGRPLARVLLGYLLAAAGFFALLEMFAWIVRPDVTQRQTTRSAAEIAAVEQLRDVALDYQNPLVLHRAVDYAEGGGGSWYPKGEAPILADLVAQGDLPPVAERVGPEPAVMEGVEGIGTYGGTWARIARTPSEVGWVGTRLSGSTLIRWSPYGKPLMPHVAKSFTASADNRVFTFELRRGMRWSDGQPFTADDILYWWNHEANDPAVSLTTPDFMRIRGLTGSVEKLGTHRVRFTFPEPNALFLNLLARSKGIEVTNCPAHYLLQYHPTLGDPEKIARWMDAKKLPTRLAVYTDVKKYLNAEHPRLWPWLYRTYRNTPPWTVVRNPYYWVVDTQGQQLPYIDRILFKSRSANLIHLALANGEASMQWQWDLTKSYTMVMDRRQDAGYDVRHWFAGENLFVIFPNLNRRVDPLQPETANKQRLLADKRFRQALSLALNRQAIIDADYNGMGVPAQVAPEPGTPFYKADLYSSFVEYDPARARRLLDDLGLTNRDDEGYRMFADGTRMTFNLAYSSDDTGIGPAEFVVDDWAQVGVRVTTRGESRTLFASRKAAYEHDFTCWSANGNYPDLFTEAYVPLEANAFAPGYARWYAQGGMRQSIPAELARFAIEPPSGHPIRQAMELYERYTAEVDSAKQRAIFGEILEIAAENIWSINIGSPHPTLVVVADGFRNVPVQAIHTFVHISPSNSGPETFYLESPADSPGAVEQTKQAILTPTLAPELTDSEVSTAGSRVAWLIRSMVVVVAVLLVCMVAVKHPYIGRRFLIMVPTLGVISVVVFFLIQLPPGDFVSAKMLELEMKGDEQAMQEVVELKELFFLEEPMVYRYAHWVGLVWFLSFDSKDMGLLQGHMGRSMEDRRAVNDIVGDRILLTFLISLGTILFTWAMALPIGIYSAVRQYSRGDYLLTFVGFIGMCVPDFLLALLLMFASSELLGIHITGLFSSQYGAQPEWTWGKVLDLLTHIWVPVVVLGVQGTASMIRIMRANLLDELRKPYVLAAEARGVRPAKLLFKYPVRLALNPFISGIGALFPQLVSGGAIVGIIMSLPTVGPLMLSAIMSEDMYLAGSMLMVLSLLGIMGTLISDLLLLWLDPRIAFDDGRR